METAARSRLTRRRPSHRHHSPVTSPIIRSYFHAAVSAADIDADENRIACSADSLSGIDCSLNVVVTRFQWL
ncbi:hypothetical protein Droror1_Dr00022428 [Drosera rotundifolia]